MPIYAYVCQECGAVREILQNSGKRRRAQICSDCGGLASRRMDQEGVTVVGDIEPSYDVSLGQYIGSRREKREVLKLFNAYDPTIERGGDPSGGIVKEERYEILKQDRTDIFKRRGREGWGKPADPEKDITVEGVADYSETRDAARMAHAKALKAKGRDDLASRFSKNQSR